MAIAKNPKRNQSSGTEEIIEQDAQAFISGASSTAEVTEAATQLNKKPVMVRIDPAMIARIDRAAKRLGLSRSAFLVSSAAERLERMEAGD